MARTMGFKKCACKNPQPHGYFYMGDEQMGLPVLSVEAGEAILDEVIRVTALSPDVAATVRAELEAAGLQERMGEDERGALTFSKSVIGMPTELAAILARLE